jgi:hypothetical protein
MQDFDPLRPWDVVFREAALRESFWSKEVDKKVFQHLTHLASEDKLTDEGFGMLEEAPSSLKAARGSGRGAGNGKKKFSSDSEAEGPPRKRRQPRKGNGKGRGGGAKNAPKGGAAKGGGKAQETIQFSNGKYVKYKGLQVCFAYNRALNGCQEICPDGRAHVCELCTERHRSVQCTVVPKRN